MRSLLLACTTLALSVGQTLAAVEFGGVNIAGFDFGCTTNTPLLSVDLTETFQGKCDVSKVVAPLHEYKGKDGAAQMEHFVKDGGLNAFRLPVGWQFLVDEPGAPLNAGNMKKYDALVQACLATGSLCIIDIHNYARWDGLIIGQGGPTDEQFANLWSQLATKYAKSPKVAMGIVNEPHEGNATRSHGCRISLNDILVPDITRWAKTCQTVVDAIRKAGATEHYIMLPGNGYTSAATFVSSGSAAALARVKDSDGSTDKLIFEVHKYLDKDNSGTHTECVSSYVDTFEDLTKFLTNNKRKAILAEVGGGPEHKSCLKNVCTLLSYLNDNSAVYMGYLGWGAGSFDETYELSLTPNEETMKDVPLMTECFVKLFSGSAGSPPSSGSGNTPPSSGSGDTPPSSGSGNTSPSSGSNDTLPSYGSGNSPPSGSSNTPPSPGTNNSPPSYGSNNSSPPSGSDNSPPTSGSSSSYGSDNSPPMSSGGGGGGGGAMPPAPSQSHSEAPYPIPSSNGTADTGSGSGGVTGTGGMTMPMPTGSLPGGQGGYQQQQQQQQQSGSGSGSGSGSSYGGSSGSGQGSNDQENSSSSSSSYTRTTFMTSTTASSSSSSPPPSQSTGSAKNQDQDDDDNKGAAVWGSKSGKSSSGVGKTLGEMLG
ncbi:MAG: hypothetical protein Q9216_003508, partial [Gyalolechia sp. 2 TL-2023]